MNLHRLEKTWTYFSDIYTGDQLARPMNWLITLLFLWWK